MSSEASSSVTSMRQARRSRERRTAGDQKPSRWPYILSRRSPSSCGAVEHADGASMSNCAS
jgi:hypothetical protein